jgi:excisionase family DNA binding protein
MTAHRHAAPPSPPSAEEVELARTSSRMLAACLGHGETARLKVIDGDDEIVVPVRALHLLVQILANMAEGKTVGIMPSNAELTTQQAADFLNVSRPFLVSLLEGGSIDFHKIGSHRRIYVQDLLAYKTKRDAQSEAALDELAAQAQELDFGY